MLFETAQEIAMKLRVQYKEAEARRDWLTWKLG